MYYFIINPNSSSGKGLLIWKSIEPVLKERNVDYHPFFTKDRESTAHLVKRLCTEKAPATIVAVGGDGTVNDVLNGLSNFENITFGYISSGSGNDLARGLHLETNPEKALERILSPTRTESLRIGSVSAPAFSRRFLVSSGLGFDAAVCEGALHSRFKKFLNQLHLGKLTYTGIALKELFLSHCPKAKLILDEATVVEVPAMFFTAAMNLPYEGGGFQFCPKADPKDDRLDLILVEKMPKLKILCLLPTAFFGKHTRFHGVHIYTFKEATLITERPLFLHTDGEIPGKTMEATWRLLPEKLSMILE